MVRARFTLGCLGAFTIAFGMSWACIPHPGADFEDYQERVAALPRSGGDASTFDVGPPPANAVEGTYYGACLAELAFGSASKRFNFFTTTKYTPEAGGAKLQMTIQPLKVVNNQPPATVTKADAVGSEIATPPADVAASGRFRLELGLTKVAGAANPITGSDVEIENAFLDGRFGEARFCARLGGRVTQPAAAARDLDPELNICHFIPIKDGDPMPTFVNEDFQPESCPLD